MHASTLMTDSFSSLPTDAPPIRALVLDDDLLMCHFLERSLERRGFTVVFETSAQDALELLAAQEFDVVVSDLNMEGLDGLAFIQRVIALHLDVPVILVTASATTQVAAHAVQRGAWDCLAKPIDVKLLASVMNRAGQHRRMKKELAP